MKPVPSSYNSKTSTIAMPRVGPGLVMLLSLASLSTSCTQQERSSLLQFVSELSQDGRLSSLWENTTDCCNWEGITCSSDRMVTDVLLDSRSLQGNISQSLGNLTGLLRLNLSNNMLSGGLPLELLFSSSILVLDVSFNQLNGELHGLPSSIPGQPLQVLNISSNLFRGQLTSTTWKGMGNLVVLNASNNSFTGQIPTHFCNISPSLAVLELSYNQFTSTVPQGLGNCSMLIVLKAGHNNISGTLPDELFNATSLEHLSFPSNVLHGVLDGARIMNLRNLTTLDLGSNNFIGRIPDSIGQLKILKELHLEHNNMNGELPSTLSSCTNLLTIKLRSNSFSGELTKVNFSNLPNLNTLDLMQNNFSGEIPESIYSCHKLTALRLSSNNFHGQLSKGLGYLKSLSFLSLTGNNFTNLTNALQILKSCKNLTALLIAKNFMHEIMPDDDSIDGFENLQVLSLSRCPLLGKIPHWLSNLRNLEMLFLHNNQLTGTIPDWISSLNFLFYVDISNNNLTGEIPTALTDMPMLNSEKTAALLDPSLFMLPIYVDRSYQYRKANAFQKVLNLGNNKLVGVIPPEIGLLKELLALNLSFNRLHGDIPKSMCNLTNLRVLDLSSNHLTGTIPDAPSDLHFLSQFNVSFNDLEGPVPITGQLSTFTNSSFVGNPKMCGPMLNHICSAAEAGQVYIDYTKVYSGKVIFTISFGFFFGVGVLYDQIVLVRYFG